MLKWQPVFCQPSLAARTGIATGTTKGEIVGAQAPKVEITYSDGTGMRAAWQPAVR